MFVEELLKRQSGVINRQQALAEGPSKSATTRKVKAGTWEPVPPRVFLASQCEPRVPERFGSCRNLANLDYFWRSCAGGVIAISRYSTTLGDLEKCETGQADWSSGPANRVESAGPNHP